ncbi:hypothetical protein Tco_1486450, partial [Tanacetum coccineum]
MNKNIDLPKRRSRFESNGEEINSFVVTEVYLRQLQ